MTEISSPGTWPPGSAANETRIDETGELWYWDEARKKWVLDEDPPELPGGDRRPERIEKIDLDE